MSHYIIHARVAKLEEKTEAVRAVVTGKDPGTGKNIYEIERKNIGWFVLFEGSNEWKFLGNEKPNLQVGQKVKIRIEPE